MSKTKKIIILILCIAIFMVPCLSMNAFALQEVWFSCDKPTVTENSGYVEVVSSAGTFVFVVYSYDTDKPFFYTTYDEAGYLYFYCDIDNQLNRANCYSYYLSQDGRATATPFWVSEKYSYFRVYNIYKINGYNVDVSRVSAQIPSNPYSFYYSSDVIINDTLNQILGVLSANSGNSQQIIDAVTNNNNVNTDKITQNEDENTQEIIDNQNQLQENEKTEAGDTGGGGVDEIGSVVPNDSQGFVNSLGSLVNAMSYSGTNCNWELPSVSLPAIDGVMPEIKLWDKKEISFEYWINQIPSGILLLVQSLLTIALIIYCFKELYSIISYVLTLKGGGASE